MFKDLFGKRNNNDDYQRQRHDYFAEDMNSYITDRDDDYNYVGNDNYSGSSNNYNFENNNFENNNDMLTYVGDDDSKYDYYTDDDFKDEYEKNQEEQSNEEELVYVVPDRANTTGKVIEIDGDKFLISYTIKDKDYTFEYEKGRNELFAVGQTLSLGYIMDTPEKAYVLPGNSYNPVNQMTQLYQKDNEAEERYAQAVSESRLRSDWCKGYGVISDVYDTHVIITYNVAAKEHKIELSKTENDTYTMGTVVTLQYRKGCPDVYEILEIKDHSKDEQIDFNEESMNSNENNNSDNKGLFGGLFENNGFGGMQALGGYGSGMPSFGGTNMANNHGAGSKSEEVVVEWGETFGMIAEDNGEKVKVAYMVDEQAHSIWVTKTKTSWKVGLRMKVKYNLSNPGISSVVDMGNEHLTNRLRKEAEKEEENRRRARNFSRYSNSPEEELFDVGLDLLNSILRK